MIKVELVITDNCEHCQTVRQIFADLGPAYDFKVTEHPARSDRGHELVDKYYLRTAPGIVIDNEFFASGLVSKEEIIKRFEVIKNR